MASKDLARIAALAQSRQAVFLVWWPANLLASGTHTHITNFLQTPFVLSSFMSHHRLKSSTCRTHIPWPRARAPYLAIVHSFILLSHSMSSQLLPFAAVINEVTNLRTCVIVASVIDKHRVLPPVYFAFQTRCVCR